MKYKNTHYENYNKKVQTSMLNNLLFGLVLFGSVGLGHFLYRLFFLLVDGFFYV